MVSFNKNNIFTLLSILVLFLGFQNCGNSSFQNTDSIQNEPASSLLTGDTKYKEGLDFAAMSLDSGATDLVLNFEVSKNKNKDYSVLSGEISYVCSFEHPNSSEELLQITEISTLSHPSMVSSVFDVCDSSGSKDVFYAIGRQSKIYLTLKDENEDCYSGNPQKLLDLDQRVFVVDNLFIGDIQELIDAVEQDIMNDTKCSAFTSEEG